ncbi:hypothetical protein RRG08_021778 [Elysia crispata]|uniref:Uncharacterized protein n=1 Tax=Elysia crispata TaxID=231223 RepID=A0AAE0ZYL6_9GAST|nr:hypothetical protein RRG08_021778 [Elysia crispata]
MIISALRTPRQRLEISGYRASSRPTCEQLWSVHTLSPVLIRPGRVALTHRRGDGKSYETVAFDQDDCEGNKRL